MESIVEKEAAAKALAAAIAERDAAIARAADFEKQLAGSKSAKPYEPPQAASTAAYLQMARDKVDQFKAEFVIPSWSRGLITAAVVIALGCGVAMAGGALAQFFVAGAVSMAMPVFLQWIVATCAWAVAIYFGGKAMFWVGRYFLTAKVDADIASVRNGVAHALTSPPKYAQPVYTAA